MPVATAGISDERVSVVGLPRAPGARSGDGERMRERFEERLDARGPEAEAA